MTDVRNKGMTDSDRQPNSSNVPLFQSGALTSICYVCLNFYFCWCIDEFVNVNVN